MITLEFASLAVIAAAALASPATAASPGAKAHDGFFANLSSLCGRKFEGEVVTTDPADADFAGRRLLMHVRDCSAEEIRIPFEVGEDRSRTWVVTRTETGLRLKHDHRHPDGTTDVLHWYGGETSGEGSTERQEFPVDQESVDLFDANGASVSTTNVWAMEVRPAQIFAYELRRANRHFRVEFDLTRPVVE